jgi:hypothetical protein
MQLTELRGLPKVDWAFTFAAAAYNLVRAPQLLVMVIRAALQNPS